MDFLYILQALFTSPLRSGQVRLDGLIVSYTFNNHHKPLVYRQRLTKEAVRAWFLEAFVCYIDWIRQDTQYIINLQGKPT